MKKRAAPSLFHSSLPCTPSLAAKKSVPPIAARCPGLLEPVAWIHLYFVVQADRVCVAAVWSAFRGRGPAL